MAEYRTLLRRYRAAEKARVPTRITPAEKSNEKASTARRDIGEFNHLAVLTMHQQGHTRDAIAEALGLSLRSVRRYINTPCEAFDQQRHGIAWRGRVERYERSGRRSSAPFLVVEYLKDRIPPEQAVWLDDLHFTKDRVAFYLFNGMTQSAIARKLGITRQTVSQHVAELGEEGSQRVQ